jgi:tRNA(Ile)-lysidine synthase
LRGAKPERALDALVRAAVPLRAGGTVVVACSGGPDSVALASILDRIARSDGFDLILAHVNAGLRESAWQDECVALSVGARLGRPVHVAAPPAGRDDEATLRTARYAALSDIARAAGAMAVATAHTASDQTETVLLALFRGTGLAGLGGIAPVRTREDGLLLLRPLLRATRDELLDELYRSGLPYALDPTNRDRRYRRNAVRAALAELRTDFPQLDRSVARCAQIVREELGGGPRVTARRRLRAHLAGRGELGDVPFERIEAALAARPGRRVFLKRGIEVVAADPPDGAAR